MSGGDELRLRGGGGDGRWRPWAASPRGRQAGPAPRGCSSGPAPRGRQAGPAPRAHPPPDTGLQLERTILAWRRTLLAALVALTVACRLTLPLSARDTVWLAGAGAAVLGCLAAALPRWIRRSYAGFTAVERRRAGPVGGGWPADAGGPVGGGWPADTAGPASGARPVHDRGPADAAGPSGLPGAGWALVLAGVVAAGGLVGAVAAVLRAG